MIIDSHCHLDYPELFDQLDDVVKRAELNQVKHFLTICTTLQSFKKIQFIIKKYKNIYGTFGIHPHETKDFTHIDTKFILKLISKHKKIDINEKHNMTVDNGQNISRSPVHT